MQVRHRIPSIFNLSMVDVLCCALGCIILLWLVYFKEARERTMAANQTNTELTATKLKLETVLRDLTSSQRNLLVGTQRSEHLSGQLSEILAQRDLLLAKWEKSDKEHRAALASLKESRDALDTMRKDVARLESQLASVTADLSQKNKDVNLAAAKVGELKSKLSDSDKQAARMEQEIANLKTQAKVNADQAAELKAKLGASEQRVAALEQQTAELEKQAAALKSLSKEYGDQAAELKSKLATSEKRAANLEKDVGSLQALSKQYGDQSVALKSKLTDNEKLAARLEQEIATFKALSKEYAQQLAKIESRAMGLETDLDKRKLDLAAADKRFNDLLTLKILLEKDLAATRTELAKRNQDLADLKSVNIGLSGAAKGLTQQLNQLKAAADNRFAGIELTGSRVLFLVDMSGSMRMKDDNTEDPDKWPLVCEILGKLIFSLPDLKQFQIILFSDRIRYPLGNDGKWYDYSGPASVKIAVEAVRAVTPQNATNMSVVFEEAFRFRASGLDTIYLLSDGLPNMGDGLPANSARLSDADKGAALTKYIRDKLKTTWNVNYGLWARQRVRINAVGFYYDSPDVGAFLWALARDNDGSFVGLSKP